MYKQVKAIFGSRWVFVVLLILFSASAVNIALTSAFPLMYDERYHFALVSYYSDHLSPIITAQPAELAVTGDATRLGSYLSHYLMSFPLRIIELFTNDLNAQVIALRLINIGFVAAALVLFRLFIIRLVHSKIVANGAVFLFCLLPVTSLLAAHINYDNLLLLIFAACLIAAQTILAKVKQGGKVSTAGLLTFGSMCLLGSLIKFTFLPIAVAMGLFILTMVLRNLGWKRLAIGESKRLRFGLVGAVILCVVSVGLFTERYGGNVLTYGSPQPDCASVQPLNVCLQYGPWARNYNLEQAAAIDTSFEGRSVPGFVANIWAPLMVRGLGGVDSKGVVPDITKPLLIALIAAAGLICMGAIGILIRQKDPVIAMLLLGTGLYVVALLQRNYSEFMLFHEIVAVQGRYMVPFIVPVAAVGIVGIMTYGHSAVGAMRNMQRRITLLGSLNPAEAYQRSAAFWSAKVWRRSAEG